MADTPDTPPADDTPAPAPRRRAPRKSAGKPEGTATKRAPRRAAAKEADQGIVARVEEGAVSAAKSVRSAGSRTAAKAGDAVTDTARKAGDAVTGTARKAATAVGAVKPRSTKRATTRTPAKGRGKNAASKSTLGKATDKVGGKWGAAAIAGGLAAAGAAAAALLTLRSSSPKTDTNTPPSGDGAHQPDGADSSKSFAAGIADENTVPNA